MSKYSHLFFDLDRTLWDFDSNSFETLKEIYAKYDIGNIINAGCDDFYKSFLTYNYNLWNDFKSGKIIKSTIRFKRFYLTLKAFGIESNKLSKLMSDDFIALSPIKNILLPGTHDVLDYLMNKYSLHIITNGFKDIQLVKLKNSDLLRYFDKVIISEVVGVHKPDKKIFRKALQLAKAKKPESIMIGDDLTADIIGAKNFGIDQVYFNPAKIIHHEVVTHEISNLKELMGFF
jgi:putative hydrolase of the HAD superfamily